MRKAVLLALLNYCGYLPTRREITVVVFIIAAWTVFCAYIHIPWLSLAIFLPLLAYPFFVRPLLAWDEISAGQLNEQRARATEEIEAKYGN